MCGHGGGEIPKLAPLHPHWCSTRATACGTTIVVHGSTVRRRTIVGAQGTAANQDSDKNLDNFDCSAIPLNSPVLMVISLVTHICTMRKEGSGTGNFKLKRSAAPFALSAPMPGTVRAQAYSPRQSIHPNGGRQRRQFDDFSASCTGCATALAT